MLASREATRRIEFERGRLQQLAHFGASPISACWPLAIDPILFSRVGDSAPNALNFVRNAAFVLNRIEASRAAATLAFRDVGLSTERRFGPPEVGEIIEAATKREAELSAFAAYVTFLANLASRASQKFSPRLLNTNGSQRSERGSGPNPGERDGCIAFLLNELRAAGKKLWGQNSDVAKTALAAFAAECNSNH